MFYCRTFEFERRWRGDRGAERGWVVLYCNKWDELRLKITDFLKVKMLFWTPHFSSLTPHFGWTQRLKYSVVQKSGHPRNSMSVRFLDHPVDPARKPQMISENEGQHLPGLDKIDPQPKYDDWELSVSTCVAGGKRVRAVDERRSEHIRQVVAVAVPLRTRRRRQLGRAGAERVQERADRAHSRRSLSGGGGMRVGPGQFDHGRHVLAVAEELNCRISDGGTSSRVRRTIPVGVVVRHHVVDLLTVKLEHIANVRAHDACQSFFTHALSVHNARQWVAAERKHPVRIQITKANHKNQEHVVLSNWSRKTNASRNCFSEVFTDHILKSVLRLATAAVGHYFTPRCFLLIIIIIIFIFSSPRLSTATSAMMFLQSHLFQPSDVLRL